MTALSEEIEKYQVFHQHITLAEAILQNLVNILISKKNEAFECLWDNRCSAAYQNEHSI